MPLVILIFITICAPYVVNAYKFANCDFEANYKCEAIHGAGIVIPPTSFVTVWFDSDK
jgi:hypothetical protein